MTPNYVDPLITTVTRAAEMLFGVSVEIAARRLDEHDEAPFEVSGIVGITGPLRGGLVISFPRSFAAQLTARMLGEPPDGEYTEDDTCDCIAEFSNVVAGNLLPELSRAHESSEEDFGTLRISLPSVVVGEHRVVWRREDLPCPLVLFDTALGQFSAGINLRHVPA